MVLFITINAHLTIGQLLAHWNKEGFILIPILLFDAILYFQQPFKIA